MNRGQPAVVADHADALLHPLEHALRVFGGAPRQHDDEFLAAVAAHDVVGADLGAQRRRERAEGAVAGLVAVPVVELLEVVDVGQARATPACPWRAVR